MSRRKIKKRKDAINIKALVKQKDLLELIQSGASVEDIMENTGLNIMEITKAMESIYSEYKDVINEKPD